MKNRNSFKLRYIISAIALIGLTACSSSTSDSPDDGGGGIIIGTGKTLEGTTTSNKLYASNTVEVRARSGQQYTGAFSAQGRFTVDEITGSGPWLVRSNLGNDNFLYGIATDTAEDTVVQNIHSYTDAVVRSWFLSRGLDVDSVFDSTDANLSMPSNAEIAAIYNGLTAVISDVIDNYSLSGVNLNTVEFAANGSGVDKFILQNPVIHNDGSITIVIFDPDNDTASVAVEDLNLSTDLTAADTIAPSAPTELRALPSAIDEITLVWDVASDNIGIARYAISRDGQQVATSPYPVFVDGGLTADTQYSYSVSAIDAAGNTSDASLTATASPMGSMDTTPPPTPSSVLIDTRRGSLDLTWTQTGISDVASYAISRGTNPSNLPEYINVNSTFFFDEAVNAGVQYCYEISAVDASGNASAPTGLVCATAPGAVVASSGSSTPTTPPVTNTPSSDSLTAPQVDVSDLACVTEFEETIIRTDTTISAGCYVSTGITVVEPANLTLEPGVVIKFGVGRVLTISQGGSLTAVGTAANPIILTGREPTPGHWVGVQNQSASTKNVFDHVQIEYAGRASDDVGGINFIAFGNATTRLAMSNSTVRFNAGPGMSFNGDMPLATFNGNRITGNAYTLNTPPESVDLLDKASIYTGNDLDAIVVEGTNLTADTTWPKLAVPYHSDGFFVSEGIFSVEAGTNILFEEGAELRALPDSTIRMIGTELSPITLSGLTARKGGWEGVSVVFSNNDHQLRHVTIQHAGAGSDEDAALNILSNNANVTRVALDNVTISDSLGFGIGAQQTATFTEFENVTITGNDGVASVGIYAAQIFNNAGSYTGNVDDAIKIRDNINISDGAVTLSNSDIPYLVKDIRVSEPLTLEAGVTLLMDTNSIFKVFRDGALTANGTAASPVSIVGQQRIAGAWAGIDFEYTSSPLNRLTHTLIADGGSGTGFGRVNGATNIYTRCSSISPTRLTLENSQIENSLGYGLFVEPTGCQVTIDSATTFRDNALGDMN